MITPLLAYQAHVLPTNYSFIFIVLGIVLFIISFYLFLSFDIIMDRKIVVSIAISLLIGAIASFVFAFVPKGESTEEYAHNITSGLSSHYGMKSVSGNMESICTKEMSTTMQTTPVDIMDKDENLIKGQISSTKNMDNTCDLTLYKITPESTMIPMKEVN